MRSILFFFCCSCYSALIFASDKFFRSFLFLHLFLCVASPPPSAFPILFFHGFGALGFAIRWRIYDNMRQLIDRRMSSHIFAVRMHFGRAFRIQNAAECNWNK